MVHRERKAIINLHQELKGAVSAGNQSCHCFCGNNNNFTTSCWVTNSLHMCTTRRTQGLFYNIQTLLKVLKVNEVLPTVFAVTELISAKIKWLLDYIISYFIWGHPFVPPICYLPALYSHLLPSSHLHLHGSNSHKQWDLQIKWLSGTFLFYFGFWTAKQARKGDL